MTQSIFSSQLINVDNNGKVSVIADSYWFAVVATPLTVFTFGVWRFWLRLSMRAEERKQKDELYSEKESTDPQHWPGIGRGRFTWAKNPLKALGNRRRGIGWDDTP